MLRVTKLESGKTRHCEEPKERLERGQAGVLQGPTDSRRQRGEDMGAGACVHVCEQAYSAGICGCVHTGRHTNTWRMLGSHSEDSPPGL